MAYSYKGAISFGLIYIPITLNAAIRENDISFNLLDKKTRSRIQYKKTCVDCEDRVIRQEDIVKGYEYEENKYVIFTDEDFEKIKSKSDKNVTIEQFIDMEEIDPLYFDRAFYVVPTGAEKAYKLLLTAMEQENKAGIAKAVLGNKQVLIALRVKNGQMLLNTLYFYEEVQKNPAKSIDVEVNEKELAMAKTLIESMSGPFEIENFKDEYREKLQAAIDRKIAGKEIIAPKDKESRKVVDLMEALRLSLQDVKPAKRKGPENAPKSKVRSAQRGE